MAWHNDFLTNKKFQLSRHLVFWLIWWLYLSLTKQYEEGPDDWDQFIPLLGHHIFLKTFLLLILQALGGYALIYYLLPELLFNKKWLAFILGLFLIALFIFITTYACQVSIFPSIDRYLDGKESNITDKPVWSAISIGLLNTPKIFSAVIAVKLMQFWQQKQNEKQQLEKEKIYAEMELLKSKLKPVFLLNSLQAIYDSALQAEARSGEMLLVLSDLLSYMMYECDPPTVSLEREISMMKKFLTLEKLRQNNQIDIEFSTRGITADLSIPPFILLPLIENCYENSSNSPDQPWINIDISFNAGQFSMVLLNGIYTDHEMIKESAKPTLKDLEKRLSLLYPGNYELAINIEEEMQVVILNIKY